MPGDRERLPRSGGLNGMARGYCHRHGHACTCAMGNLYRFVEPVVLHLLKQKEQAHGYDLFRDLTVHALTDSEIDRGALYRTLNQLEQNGHLTSEWDAGGCGPSRRVYRLTPQGEKHLAEWAAVLERLAHSLTRFVDDIRTDPRS